MFPKQYSKKSVKYTDNHGKSSEQCSKCRHYVNPTTCEIVAGRINPNGWCKKYEESKREPAYETQTE